MTQANADRQCGLKEIFLKGLSNRELCRPIKINTKDKLQVNAHVQIFTLAHRGPNVVLWCRVGVNSHETEINTQEFCAHFLTTPLRQFYSIASCGYQNKLALLKCIECLCSQEVILNNIYFKTDVNFKMGFFILLRQLDDKFLTIITLYDCLRILFS